MSKKLFVFLISLIITVCIFPINTKAENTNGNYLKEIGILKGDLNGNLLLDEPIKRQDAIVLLSRLFQEEEQAKNYSKKTSFSDIKDPYYEPFISWAENKGLTEGIGNNLFGYDLLLTKQQFLTFMLRVLGNELYGEQYNQVPEKAIEQKIINSISNMTAIATRQDVADITVSTLKNGIIKNKNITLERQLAISNERINVNSQIFSIKEIKIKNGYIVIVFNKPTIIENSEKEKLLNSIVKQGPNIGDLSIIYKIPSKSNSKIKLIVNKELYDQGTGQLVLTFNKIELDKDDEININANYFENKKTVAHEAAHVMQQRTTGTLNQEKIVEIIDNIFETTLVAYNGTYSDSQFNGSTLQTLSTNKEYQESIGEISVKQNKNYILTTIIFNDNISSFIIDNLYITILNEGMYTNYNQYIKLQLNENNNITLEVTNIENIIDKRIFYCYFNNETLIESIQKTQEITKEQTKDLINSLLISIIKAMKKNDANTIVKYGDLTIKIK